MVVPAIPRSGLPSFRGESDHIYLPPKTSTLTIPRCIGSGLFIYFLAFGAFCIYLYYIGPSLPSFYYIDSSFIMLLHRLAYWLSFGSVAFAGAIPRDASPGPSPVIAERQATTSSPVPDGACTNGPRTRNCWSDGFSIATDFDAKAPPAGKTVTVSSFRVSCLYLSDYDSTI